jgi:hypothetical protein
VTLTLWWTDGESHRISFHHVDPGARVAERTIGFQDRTLKNVLIASQRQPIPKTFFDMTNPRGAAWQRAVGLFDEAGKGPLADAIPDPDPDGRTGGRAEGSTRWDRPGGGVRTAEAKRAGHTELPRLERR